MDALLERLRLTHLEHANPFTLSGGEQRRLSVGTMLATAPRILILDEPTFGQDSVTWAELVALIAEIVDGGVSVMASTHDLAFVDALADRRLELEHRPGAAMNPVAKLIAAALIAVLPGAHPRLGLREHRAAARAAAHPAAAHPAPHVLAAHAAGVDRRAAHRPHDRPLWSTRRARCTSSSCSSGSAKARSSSRVATILRVLAIALPAVVLFTTIDPTDLADGLAQTLRLPCPVRARRARRHPADQRCGADWQSVSLARRARGIGDRNVFARFAGTAFSLLVLSIRRGSVLATAMEARGFGAPGVRTWARPARWGAREWAMVFIGLGIGLTAITAAILTGYWRPILGG